MEEQKEILSPLVFNIIDLEAELKNKTINIAKADELSTTELTENYFDAFAPKYHTPPPVPIQIARQIENEAENMQHCYYWLYVFENTLRNFIEESLKEKYGEKWYDMLSKKVKDEIEENKNRWHGGIPPRNPLEFSCSLRFTRLS